jgi:hypothetical protein
LRKQASSCKNLKLDLCLSPCSSINSKWIRTLISGPKHDTGKTRKYFGVIGIGKDFLNGTLASQQLRESIAKWDLMKLKSFCTTKEMVSKVKRLPTEWEKIFASYTSDNRLIIRIYRELKKLNSPKINKEN